MSFLITKTGAAGEQWFCRIGHYDMNYYMSRKEAMEPPRIRNIMRPYSKIWHSFTVRPLFEITLDGKKINLSRYFEIFKEDKTRRKTSLTIKPKPWLSEYIKRWGWQMIPEESLLIARREVKEYPPPKPPS